MNPALLFSMLLMLSNSGGSRGPSPVRIGKLSLPPLGPGYIDTFRLELLLDRLHSMTNALENVNHLNQMRNIPMTKNNSFERIEESLDAVRGLIYDQRSGKQIDKISNAVSNVRKISDMEGIMSSLGPILSMLSNQNDK